MNGLLQFTYKGDIYRIRFQYVGISPKAGVDQLPERMRPKNGQVFNNTKKATVATLWKNWIGGTKMPIPMLIASGLTRCHHKDVFKKEIGRTEAIKKIEAWLKAAHNEELAAAVVACYEGRKGQQTEIEQVMD